MAEGDVRKSSRRAVKSRASEIEGLRGERVSRDEIEGVHGQVDDDAVAGDRGSGTCVR
jgi:hypothetical protein